MFCFFVACVCGCCDWECLYVHTCTYVYKDIKGEETQLLMLITSEKQDGKVGKIRRNNFSFEKLKYVNID